MTEYNDWFKRVKMLMSEIHKMDPDNVPEGFFYEAYEEGMTPRQAVEAFMAEYL